MENLQTIINWFKMTDKQREHARIQEQVEKYLKNGGRIQRQKVSEEIDFTRLSRIDNDTIEFLMR